LEQQKHIISQIRTLEPLILLIASNVVPEDGANHMKELQANYQADAEGEEEEEEADETIADCVELIHNYLEIITEYL
jgi:hydroxyethylthiazole kinase-like sugar kinase family protein